MGSLGLSAKLGRILRVLRGEPVCDVLDELVFEEVEIDEGAEQRGHEQGEHETREP